MTTLTSTIAMRLARISRDAADDAPLHLVKDAVDTVVANAIADAGLREMVEAIQEVTSFLDENERGRKIVTFYRPILEKQIYLLRSRLAVLAGESGVTFKNITIVEEGDCAIDITGDASG